jgi:hypothetical protein
MLDIEATIALWQEAGEDFWMIGRFALEMRGEIRGWSDVRPFMTRWARNEFPRAELKHQRRSAMPPT